VKPSGISTSAQRGAQTAPETQEISAQTMHEQGPLRYFEEADAVVDVYGLYGSSPSCGQTGGGLRVTTNSRTDEETLEAFGRVGGGADVTYCADSTSSVPPTEADVNLGYSNRVRHSRLGGNLYGRLEGGMRFSRFEIGSAATLGLIGRDSTDSVTIGRHDTTFQNPFIDLTFTVSGFAAYNISNRVALFGEVGLSYAFRSLGVPEGIFTGGLRFLVGPTPQIERITTTTERVTESLLSADHASLVFSRDHISRGATHYDLVHANGSRTRHLVPFTGDLSISIYDLDDVIGIDFTNNGTLPNTSFFNIAPGFANRHLITPQPNGDVVIMGMGTLINVPSTVTLPSPAGRPVPLTTLVVPGNARIMEGTSVRIRLDGQDAGPVIPIPGQEPDPNRDQTSVAITLPENTTASRHACEILLNIPSSRPRILKSLSLTVQPAVSQAPVVTQQPVPVTRHTITPRRPAVPHRPVQPPDSDHDGVPDSQDLCNNTERGREVRETTLNRGCAFGELHTR